MWGVCLGSEAVQEGFYQKVIQYRVDENGEVVITLPKTIFKPYIRHIKELSMSPKYIYDQKVSPCNHPDIIGVVCDIGWHFKLNCYFYKIRVNGKVKSKRYYDYDLNFI